MNHALRIRDLIDVPPVQTVIRLADGRTTPARIADSFVFTADVTNHLTVLAEAFERDTGQGYFLQGDFGSGKSHFLALLTAWLNAAPGTARLSQTHPGLGRLGATARRFLAVDVSLVDFRASTSLEQIVVGAFEQALKAHGVTAVISPLAGFVEHLQQVCREPSAAAALAKQCGTTVEGLDAWLAHNPRRAYSEGIRFLKELGLPLPEALVEDRHETFAKAMAAVRGAGFSGAVLLLDELSEFFRAKPDARRLNEDARTLQFLGELAAEQPLWTVAAVQEAIERTGDLAQVTFRKIKDRFPVRLALSAVHIRDLISKRLVLHKPGADEELLRVHAFLRRQFPTFTCDFELFRNTYPVHPVTLGLLEGLGDLFSVHRGIVDFVHARVAGDPQRHISGILDRPTAELLAPDSLYDHFAQRLAEFSDFNVFPRQIVPHLDECIGRSLEDDADRALARRLVRILVLYRIHPTAEPTTVRHLTEMVGCVPSPQQPELNVRFVAEAILDPLVRESRFLVRQAATGTDPLAAVYTIAVQEQSGKTLAARVEQAASDLQPDDTRLLASLLPDLGESPAWPGPGVFDGVVERSVNWRHSVRRALVAFCPSGNEAALRQRLNRSLGAGEADMALVFTLWDTEFAWAGTPIAVWKIPVPADPDDVLRQYLAARQVATELRPANPVDAPMIEPSRDTVRRLQPVAHQAALAAVYAGAFTRPQIRVEPGVCQLRRFERLLEAAAEVLLDERYPRFAEIAARGAEPSPRQYQRLLEELVIPGSLSLQEARKRGLAAAIDGLAAPLGLVDVRSGSYLVSPDVAYQPLLKHLFSLLRPAQPTPLAEVRHALATGQYGMPDDMASFLLAALACSGQISLLSHNRALPLDFLRLGAVETADAIAPGEVISQADRDTLLAECRFLAPAQGWESFGLKQQREAWQAALKFKESNRKLIDDLNRMLAGVERFSTFAGFDLNGYRRDLQRLDLVVGEVKVSYEAREGLERLLRAWRASQLTAGEMTRLRQLHRFLAQRADAFIFICHYVRHRAVEMAAAEDPEIASRRQAVLAVLGQPELLLSDEDGTQLQAEFDSLRVRYVPFYTSRHAARTALTAKPGLGKHHRRALGVLRRLAAIEPLDRPPGLDQVLAMVDAPAPETCQRDLSEPLLRAPVCDCGLLPGPLPTEPPAQDPGPAIDAALTAYTEILQAPQLIEACRARAFALAEASPKAAGLLNRLVQTLQDREGVSATTLLDLADDGTVGELGQALAGRTRMERRQLGDLVTRLGGRRLSPPQLRQAVQDWIGDPPADAVVAIEPPATAPGAGPDPGVGWWPAVHPGLRALLQTETGVAMAPTLARALEQHYPASQVRPLLTRLPDQDLAAVLGAELGHTEVARQAWLLLAERLLSGPLTNLRLRVESRHADPATAAAICQRLHALGRLIGFRTQVYPQRLRVRLPVSEIALDSWATAELQGAADRFILELADSAHDWFDALPAGEPLPLADRPLIVVMDAVPPDVWLDAMDGIEPDFGDGLHLSWHRLECEPDTPSGMAALFGFRGDPADELAARAIPYQQVSGTEAAPLREVLPSLEAVTTAVVVRVSLFDQGAHRAALRLAEMPGRLRDLLLREVLPLRATCQAQGRQVVLTTDHGLSFTARGLSHGAGGVFEQAVPRFEWGTG